MDWTWLKRFRVWEANRKVFVEPENYLEPELRDDKTPQFEPEPESPAGREKADDDS